MCGIAGLAIEGNSLPCWATDAVNRMTQRMRRRGPDAAGIWSGCGIVLGHRRLAILDLDARSNQPMLLSDGNFCIVFNGEIYNYGELRRELAAEGVVFRTSSDTEVLLSLYARYKERMLPKLRGMFAFAIWDLRARELFLARDPYGIKPLYYARVEDGFIFASQVKALLESGLVHGDHEQAGIAGFYLWGYVPEPWTLHRGIFSLPSGSWMLVRNGEGGIPVTWKDIRESWRHGNRIVSDNDLLERVRTAVTDSVRAHLVSDVPVSVFLSGGVDSATIAGLASELGANVEGITVGFEEFQSRPEDEVPGAAIVASHFGLPHHFRIVSRKEFEEDVPQILDSMDQPSTDGVNTWFASKVASECGYKVVLSGLGGDELFWGYTHLIRNLKRAKWARMFMAIPGATASMQVLLSQFGGRHAHPKLQAVPKLIGSLGGIYLLNRGLFMLDELPGLMGVDEARQGLARLESLMPVDRAPETATDAHWIFMSDSSLYMRNQLLRDSDWASMHHSLELRTPLVDSTLLDALEPLFGQFKNGAGKLLLASTPSRKLPVCITNRPKTGFGLPFEHWLADAEFEGKQARTRTETRRRPWARRWATTVMAHHLGTPALNENECAGRAS
jgi:asparagine synthase (glutamine-hydrolysing)